MLFTVIIPVIERNSFLLKCLEGLNKQTYKEFEVILISERRIILKKTKYDFPLRILHKSIVRPGQKRNYASKLAKGKYLSFIDDDAYPHKNWLLNARKKIYKIKEIYFILGGPGILPKDENLLSKVIDLSFRSNFYGSAKLRYERVKKFYDPNKIDDWPSVNMFIKKSSFIKLNGFDNNYWPGEDSKLCNKLITNGGKIVYDPNVYVFHHRRSSILKHLKQIFRYSFIRGIFFQQKDKNSRKVNYLYPSLFNIVIFTLYFFSVKISLFFIFISVCIVYINFYLNKTSENFIIKFFSSIVVIINILTYGIGFFLSFINKKYKTKLGR